MTNLETFKIQNRWHGWHGWHETAISMPPMPPSQLGWHGSPAWTKQAVLFIICNTMPTMPAMPPVFKLFLSKGIEKLRGCICSRVGWHGWIVELGGIYRK